MSMMVATGRAATQGVLFRDAGAIEKLRDVDTVIVDKTGTLTEGRPAFDTAIAGPGYSPDEVLRLAASLDQGSEHPLADAIVSAAREKGLALVEPVDFESGSGIGVRGSVEGRRLLLGNTALMQQEGIAVDASKADAERLRGEGATVMRCTLHFDCLIQCGLRDGIARIGQFCIDTQPAAALRGDVDKGLLFRGASALPFGEQIRPVRELIDYMMTDRRTPVIEVPSPA